MKTYEEMTESILQKTEKRRAKLARRKRLLSLFAAVAAVVIVMTAIPVGALIIANRAQTPPEAGSETKTEFSTDRHPIADKKNISYISKMIITENSSSKINDITTTAVSPFDLPKGYGLFYEGERYLDFSEGLSGTLPADGGLLRRTYAQFAHEFTDDADNYQVDIVFTDGVNEICHEKYFSEKSLTGMINIIFDFYLFVPDYLEYGELRFYFNVLTNGAKAVPDFDDDPDNIMCVGFAQKYQCMVISHGDETPSRDRKELEKSVDNKLHKYIYMCVDRLYSLNNSRDTEMSTEREGLAKEIYTSVLTSYKADHPEEYAQIIKEFCDNEAGETYDGNGNLIYKPHLRHDPLENDYTTDSVNSCANADIIDNTRNDPIELTTYVVGSVFWGHKASENSQEVTKPAINLRIECYDVTNGSNYLLGSAYTDSNGQYSVSFDLPGQSIIDIKTVITTCSYNINVENENGSNNIELNTNYNVYAGSTKNNGRKDFHADEMATNNRIISIYQALAMASQYVYSIENSYLDLVNVCYTLNPGGFSTYDDEEGYISIATNQAYEWDDIQRVYGLYLASEYGIKASNAFMCYEHTSDLSLTFGKSVGISTAWYNGFATLFAIKAQQQMNAASLLIPYVGDLNYDFNIPTYTIHFNIETMTDTVTNNLCDISEANELTVAGILLDLIDDVEYGINSNDNVDLIEGNVWTLIKNNGCQTLSSFINCFTSSSVFTNQEKVNAGYTLEWFGLAATGPNIAYYLNGQPHFTWTSPQPTGSFFYNLRFYDLSYNFITQCGMYGSNSANIPVSTWNNITNGRTSVYVVVTVYHYNNEAVTGQYYSKPYRIDI